ncbi:tagaturonate reductase [Cohnella nanjingensis]|uniref:Tagaturonate reductase n=1 Tax=Cohnella nanjingensis TaxID=1387779 RepID=A0A7X0RZH7_9BACL|nr:tagaturonate reductase [Cohnella nanjingensis]MBB6674929.1 tagaturonate reductase [Cohnella nanjingensis]
MRPTLNVELLDQADRERWEAAKRDPVTVLQIGEGNFLRGFADWMIHECRKQGLFAGSVAVTQPRLSGRPKIEALAAQDGLYTLVTRGLVEGVATERAEIVGVFAQAFDPYADWAAFETLAASPSLRFVLSNTTEAGLAYREEPVPSGGPIPSFPGKIAYLLHLRYRAFGGAADKGIVLLPCELLERNGDALRDAVLRHAADWGLDDGFRTWVLRHNRFLNSLVDRIVTGHPGEAQAEAWSDEWGYADGLVDTAEPYHLWAIEAEPEMDRELPFVQAGLNVHWVDDLTPFQQRKVRILNGAHTLMTPLGLLYDIAHVGELIAHPELGPFVRDAVREEIVPALPYAADEMNAYAASVFERFANPYIRHRLADIAMNSLSKFKTRLLPTLAHYASSGAALPDRLVRGFAALLRLYRVERDGDAFIGTSLTGTRYAIRDDERLLGRIADRWQAAGDTGEPLHATVRRLLADEALWGEDLSAWPALADRIAEHLAEWEEA